MTDWGVVGMRMLLAGLLTAAGGMLLAFVYAMKLWETVPAFVAHAVAVVHDWPYGTATAIAAVGVFMTVFGAMIIIGQPEEVSRGQR